MINCASPDYLTRFGYPETLDDLASHALIHYSATLGTRPQGFEYYNGSATRWVKREAYCRLTAQKPTSRLYRRAWDYSGPARRGA